MRKNQKIRTSKTHQSNTDDGKIDEDLNVKVSFGSFTSCLDIRPQCRILSNLTIGFILISIQCML